MPIQEDEYRDWLAGDSGLSPKGQNDLISRLRRAERLVQITANTTFEKYLSELRLHPSWETIPSPSQQSIVAAARRYLTWRSSTEI
jgi:hypothetical protein